MENTRLETSLPGPRAREIIGRDRRVVSPSYVRDCPFVMSHGRGAEVWDVDGHRFVDFAAGIAVCSTGHGHPAVVAAIQKAAEQFLHISSDYWHEGQVRVAEVIRELAPVRGDAVSFFANSGTEAVEAALKLARHATGRPRYLAFLGGFHGRTLGALACTASKYTQQRRFFPTMPGVTHVPYPNPYRPLFAGNDQGRAVIAYIEQLFERNVPADEVAAILVEPIQGEGGYIVPPEGFLAGLRELCDRQRRSGRRARTQTRSAATRSAAPRRSRRWSWCGMNTLPMRSAWASASWRVSRSSRSVSTSLATCAVAV